MRKFFMLCGAVAVALLGMLAPNALADDQPIHVCTSDGAPQPAEGEGEGALFTHISASPDAQECAYLSNGGVPGYVISTLNAWEVVVTDAAGNVVDRDSGPDLAGGSTGLYSGDVTSSYGDTVTVRVFPVCADSACASSIEAAIGE